MDGFYVKLVEGVCLGSSLVFSGFCYYHYKKNQTTLDKLDDAPHLPINGSLKDILKATAGACLQYAVIEGAVQPVDEPLTSHFKKETAGVLQKFMLREHRLVWNSLTRTWMDSERVLHQRVSAVPFVLVGPDETSVRVLCPLQASGVHMEVTHEKFHQVIYGLGDIVGQYLSGEKLKGQLETEEMLKAGAALTGVGEVVLDTDGSLNLRPPSDGSEYFLSLVDFDTLRGELNSTAFWWKVLAIASALAGTAVLLWVGRRYHHQLRVRREQEQERRDFERLLVEAQRIGGPDAPNDRDEECVENACVICLSQPRNCVLLNCGHVCCCYNCYQALPQRQCPICRQDISRVLPIYNV